MDETDKPRYPLFSRDSKLLLSGVVLNSIPSGYMNVVPLVYLAEIGFNPALIGEIYAASSLANTLGLIPFGLLADRHSRKWFLVLGSLLPFFSYAIFGLTLGTGWLILASVIGGVGLVGGLAFALSNPSLMPLLAKSTSNRHRTTIFGLYQGLWTIAFGFGALLTVLPSFLSSYLKEGQSLAHSQSYFVMSLLALVSVLPLLFVREDRNEKKRISENEAPDVQGLNEGIAGNTASRAGVRVTSEESNPLRKMPLSPGSWSRIVRLSVVYALLGIGVGTLIQLLPTWYALRFGVSESTIGFWSAVANIAPAAAVPMIPGFVRSRGMIGSAVIMSLLGTSFLAVMPLTPSFEVAAGLYVGRVVCGTFLWAVLNSLTVSLVADAERATTIGITYTAWGLCTSLGTYVGGLLLADGLLMVPFGVGVCSFAGVALALRSLNSFRPVEERSLIT